MYGADEEGGVGIEIESPKEEHLATWERTREAAEEVRDLALKEPVPLSKVVEIAERYHVFYTRVLEMLEFMDCKLDPVRGVVCMA